MHLWLTFSGIANNSLIFIQIEQPHKKTCYCTCENKRAGQLISSIVFHCLDTLDALYINLKFQYSSYLLWLYSLDGVLSGCKMVKTGSLATGLLFQAFYLHSSLSLSLYFIRWFFVIVTIFFFIIIITIVII